MKKYLEDKGYDSVVTREPGGTVISEAIREIILNPEYKEMSYMTELLLYAAARAQLVNQIIRLQEGLNKLGYKCGNTDGDFGLQTQAALKAFQEDHSLPAAYTGINYYVWKRIVNAQKYQDNLIQRMKDPNNRYLYELGAKEEYLISDCELIPYEVYYDYDNYCLITNCIIYNGSNNIAKEIKIDQFQIVDQNGEVIAELSPNYKMDQTLLPGASTECTLVFAYENLYRYNAELSNINWNIMVTVEYYNSDN